MTIAEARGKCKDLLAKIPRDILIISILIIASSLSFLFGFLAGRDMGQGSEAPPQETSRTTPQETDLTSQPQDGQVVASKNGTKYYLPSCAGADRISAANKVRFASASAAVAAGYAPAANCKGI